MNTFTHLLRRARSRPVPTTPLSLFPIFLKPYFLTALPLLAGVNRMVVIPAKAGIHLFCLCFLFSDCFPPMTRKWKAGVLSFCFRKDSGFRRNDGGGQFRSRRTFSTTPSSVASNAHSSIAFDPLALYALMRHNAPFSIHTQIHRKTPKS